MPTPAQNLRNRVDENKAVFQVVLSLPDDRPVMLSPETVAQLKRLIAGVDPAVRTSV